MAKIDLKFLGLYSEKSFIKVGFVEESICITVFDFEGAKEDNYIYLDKSTAIKFAKTLRTEINKIQ